MPISIQAQYFAILREQRGLALEKLQTAAPTAAALYAELAQRHRFSLPVDRVRVAVNDDFAEWSVPLKDGDTVAFIPPVAGG